MIAKALFLALVLAATAQAQTDDWAELGTYRAAKAALAAARGTPRVVFVGDSITEQWAAERHFGYVD